MGNDVTSWRAAIGNFYNHVHGISKTYTFHSSLLINYRNKAYCEIKLLAKMIIKLIIKFLYVAISIQSCLVFISLLNMICYLLQKNMHQSSRGFYVPTHSSHYNHISILNLEYYNYLFTIILQSGDIETNPGPNTNDLSCLSLVHQNIRSIRHKIEYIEDNVLDFDILCFTETHLTS